MNFFFIGIKGSGMSALATILKDLDNEVSGSDFDQKFFTDAKLKSKEIKVLNFNPNQITSEIDVVIVGNAFDLEHPQVLKAKALNLKVIYYFQYLANFAKEKNSIAIAGTNGKTTTTGLIVESFSNFNPSFLIGDGTGHGQSNSEFFIFEACEYRDTFLCYHPNVGLINNIELDHPDFFLSLDQVIESFQGFANNCKTVVLNYDDVNCKKITHNNIISFGIKNKDANMVMGNIENSIEGFNFNLTYNDKELGVFALPFFGDHMVYNTLAVIATNYHFNKDIVQIINNLKTFNGVSRRFDVTTISEKNKLYFVDDYAHHPTAIKYTIDAMIQKFPNCTISVLFQPHTFSRTKTFLKEFSQSLLKADNIYLAKIFGSIREKELGFSSDNLAQEIAKTGKNVEVNLDFLKSRSKNHVVAILGAGDIDELYKEKIIKILKEKNETN